MAFYVKLYRTYVHTEDIRNINEAKRVIGFPLLVKFDSHPRTSDPKCNIFASLAFLSKPNVNMHVDSNMCQGLVVVYEPHTHNMCNCVTTT